MKRGDIYAAATGAGFGSKPRPVIILNAQAYVKLPTKMVAPLTGEIERLLGFRPIIMPDERNGLRRSSAVMTDILIAVPEDRFGRRIGELSPGDMSRVEAAMMIILGLAA